MQQIINFMSTKNKRAYVRKKPLKPDSEKKVQIILSVKAKFKDEAQQKAWALEREYLNLGGY